jgi:hypothetical protein
MAAQRPVPESQPAPEPEPECELVYVGRVEWTDYFREAMPLLSLGARHRELAGRRAASEWEAHMKEHASATVDTAGTNTGMCIELALVPARPNAAAWCKSDRRRHDERQQALPQIAIVSDRWRWLGLKTNLAKFLAAADAEELCPEQVVVHRPDDIAAQLAARVVPDSPWVLKSANGSKGDEVHLVTSVNQVATIMDEDAASRTELQEELPFGLLHTEGDCDEAVDAGSVNDGGYVLQKHIDRPMLVEGGRKFSLRAYLLLEPAAHRVYSYEHDFEVRLADEPFDPEAVGDPSRLITNGSASGRAW